MPTISRQNVVPYSSSQMYDLVNDVERYPEFLPWCPKASVDHHHPEEMQATVYFAKGPLNQSFTTRNRLTPHERVEMELIKGPFRFLKGIWEFVDVMGGSQILFTVSFEWSNPLFNLAAGPVFTHMAETMVDAFIARAETVYA